MPKTKAVRKQEKRGRNPLLRAVRALYQSRSDFFELKDQLEIKQAEFNAKNKDLLERYEAAKAAVELNDGTLRGTVLEEYQRTQNRALAPGLEVKMRKAVMLKSGEAVSHVVEWAKREAPFLLTVDLKRFEELIETFPGLVPELATVEEVPTAFIAKDLTGAIEALR